MQRILNRACKCERFYKSSRFDENPCHLSTRSSIKNNHSLMLCLTYISGLVSKSQSKTEAFQTTTYKVRWYIVQFIVLAEIVPVAATCYITQTNMASTERRKIRSNSQRRRYVLLEFTIFERSNATSTQPYITTTKDTNTISDTKTSTPTVVAVSKHVFFRIHKFATSNNTYQHSSSSFDKYIVVFHVRSQQIRRTLCR